MAFNNNSLESVHIILFPKFGLKIDRPNVMLKYSLSYAQQMLKWNQDFKKKDYLSLFML